MIVIVERYDVQQTQTTVFLITYTHEILVWTHYWKWTIRERWLNWKLEHFLGFICGLLFRNTWIPKFLLIVHDIMCLFPLALQFDLEWRYVVWKCFMYTVQFL